VPGPECILNLPYIDWLVRAWQALYLTVHAKECSWTVEDAGDSRIDALSARLSTFDRGEWEICQSDPSFRLEGLTLCTASGLLPPFSSMREYVITAVLLSR
jgi:hypothetical protein